MRFPKGYRGIRHETIGSDVLALTHAVLMPEVVLGRERCESLRAIVSTTWYPIATLLEPLEYLDQRLGADSLRKIGQTLFALSHEERVRAALTCAEDVIYGIDTMYHAANRGKEIGGWRVVASVPGRAELEKTTPHHCVMEEGILEAALRTLQVPATIYQSECFRRGADACRFVITSHITDVRWSGKKAQKLMPKR